MHRRASSVAGLTVMLVALGGAGATPAGAQGATVTVSQPCQIAGFTLRATLTHFTPGSRVTLQGEQIAAAADADADGDATVTFKAPPLGTSDPASRTFTLTATDDAPVPRSAATTFRSATFAFGTSNAQQSPKAKRTWSFSGFPPGKAVFGHFRYNGRTRANFRFGVAAGPCGELKVKAPGIPVAGRVNVGTWTIQIDQRPTFDRFTKPRLTGSVRVFTVRT